MNAIATPRRESLRLPADSRSAPRPRVRRNVVIPFLVACWLASFAIPTRAATPEPFDLSGPWSLEAKKVVDTTARLPGSPPAYSEWGPIPATVPGTVHTDLLAAGKIPDPHFGDNARKAAWIAETPWTYTRTFTPPAGLLGRQKIVLDCEGLDTVATVTLNGHTLGHADNMFRKWTFDVKGVLRPGENVLAVAFTPLRQAMNEFAAAAKGTGPNTAYGGIADLRKATYSNGWDFAPKLAASGIYKPIRLVGYSTLR